MRSDFKAWAGAMAAQNGVFLEVQRGGWDSQKAYQNSHPSSRQFTEYANAYDLIKVYGAGWLREPGSAFGRNNAFVPGGTIFNRITSGEDPFGVNDLYAAYRLQKLANQFKFGRAAEKPSRRQTRFLFYFIVLDFLRETLLRASRPYSAMDLTNAVMALLPEENQEALQGLADSAIEVVDEYLLQESEDSLFNEPTYEGNLNTFLKGPQLGKNEDFTPLFKSLLYKHKVVFGSRIGRPISPRELITQAILQASSENVSDQ